MFDVDGFTKAAKSMGYTDEEIAGVAAMRSSQAQSPDQQLRDVQLQQAKLNLQQDQQNQSVSDPYGTNKLRATKSVEQEFKIADESRQKMADLQQKAEFNKIAKDKAKDVLTVLQNRNSYKTPQDFQTALNAVASQQASHIGFGIGGKVLSEGEKAILQPQMANLAKSKTVERGNILQRGMGWLTGSPVPEIERSQELLQDTPEQLQRKMEFFIQQYGSPEEQQQFLKQASNNPEEQQVRSENASLLQNAGADAKNIANSLLNLPKAYVDYVLEKKSRGENVYPPTLAKDIAVAGGKGIINEYNQLLGEPLKGGDIVGRIGKRAYEKPVSTALDILPFIPKLKSVTAAKAAKAGETAKAADIAGLAKQGATKEGLLPKIGTSMYSSNFTIPSKLAGRINIDEVSKVMMKNGHAGNLDELSSVANQVTGSNGIFPKINREALAISKEPIDFQSAITDSAKKLKDIPELRGSELSAHQKAIRNLIKPEGELGKTSSFNAFDAIKELENRGYQYKNSSTELSPNLVNEKVGNAYLTAADELKSAIDSQYKSTGVLDQLKTPENISAIQAISPELAKDFLKAKTMADLRSIQAPYVKLQQAINLTQNASRTPFSKIRDVTAAIGKPIGEAVLPPIMTNVGKFLRSQKK